MSLVCKEELLKKKDLKDERSEVTEKVENGISLC